MKNTRRKIYFAPQKLTSNKKIYLLKDISKNVPPWLGGKSLKQSLLLFCYLMMLMFVLVVIKIMKSSTTKTTRTVMT